MSITDEELRAEVERLGLELSEHCPARWDVETGQPITADAKCARLEEAWHRVAQLEAEVKRLRRHSDEAQQSEQDAVDRIGELEAQVNMATSQYNELDRMFRENRTGLQAALALAQEVLRRSMEGYENSAHIEDCAYNDQPQGMESDFACDCWLPHARDALSRPALQRPVREALAALERLEAEQ